MKKNSTLHKITAHYTRVRAPYEHPGDIHELVQSYVFEDDDVLVLAPPKEKDKTEQALAYLQIALGERVDVVLSAHLNEDMAQFVDDLVAQSAHLGYNVERTLLGKCSVVHFSIMNFDLIC